MRTAQRGCTAGEGDPQPKLVVNLPIGGGKRLASTSESYTDGVVAYAVPGLSGMKGWKK
jgi:lysine 2,3-aminomutase